MKIWLGAALAAAALMLQSCFFAPGKFSSTLELRRGGQYSFAYTGEVLLLQSDEFRKIPDAPHRCFGKAPQDGKAAEPGKAPQMMVIVPPGSKGADRKAPEFGTRPCTADEIAERAEMMERQRRKQGAVMAAVFGFDPDQPASIQTFISELRKYPGWRSVVHKGGGRFEIDYRASGTLTHDMVFPLFEGVVLHAPFLIVRPRLDGSVDVRAPAFGGAGGWGSVAGIGLGSGLAGRDDDFAELMKSTDGTFTIVTDGEIRTNNTAEGPITRGPDKHLSWRVTGLSREAPRALVALPGAR